MDEFLKRSDELATIIWKTSGSRFLAASRLLRRDRLSTFSVALLSVLATMAGLLEPHVSAAAHRIGINTAVISATMSLFILAISLVEGAGQVAVQASKLHDNGMLIAQVRRDIEDMMAQAKSTDTPNWSLYENLRMKYDTHLRECPVNHEKIDYRRFEVDYRRSKEFSLNGKPRIGWLEAQWIRFLHLFSAIWLSFASWTLIFGLFVFVVDWSPGQV